MLSFLCILGVLGGLSPILFLTQAIPLSFILPHLVLKARSSPASTRDYIKIKTRSARSVKKRTGCHPVTHGRDTCIKVNSLQPCVGSSNGIALYFHSIVDRPCTPSPSENAPFWSQQLGNYIALGKKFTHALTHLRVVCPCPPVTVCVCSSCSRSICVTWHLVEKVLYACRGSALLLTCVRSCDLVLGRNSCLIFTVKCRSPVFSRAPPVTIPANL